MARHSLYPSQGHHSDKLRFLGQISDGRQQLAVKAAGEPVDELTLDWVRVDLQGVALQ